VGDTPAMAAGVPHPAMRAFDVRQARRSDIYRDIARVPELYRIDSAGKAIPEGRICKVTVGAKSVLLSLRGQQSHSDPAVHLDDVTRLKLNVELGTQVCLQFRQVWWLGQFLWAWRATDPGYRIAARVATLSVALSVFGLIAGAVGIVLTWRFSK
jgi:hypothetical protein